MFLISTPLPLVVVFIALLALSAPKLASKKWAKISRLFCFIVLGCILLAAYHVMHEKGTVGLRKSDAYNVTKFTIQIRTLIAENKNQEAITLLDKFNNNYPAVAGNNEAETFLKQLSATGSNR